MKDEVAKVIAGDATAPTRSPIYAWFWQHHAEVLPKLTGVRIRWAAIAERLGELGMTDANGGKPQAETVRRTWWQVRRDKQAAQKATEVKRAKGVEAAPPAAPAPAVVPPAPPLPPLARPVFDPMDGEPDPAAKPRFKPATFKR